jgi:hypothetical protein
MLGEPGRRAARASGLEAYPSALAADPQGRLPSELRAMVQPLGH